MMRVGYLTAQQFAEIIAPSIVDVTSGTYQPVDGTLTALAAYNTNGFLVQTAADTFAGRSITAGAGITVNNGSGVAANPEIICTITQYTDEAAQDAVGAILTDTATIDFTYDDGAGTITADVKDGSITYAKMQDVSATSRILGRGTAASGDVEELSMGEGIGNDGTTLYSGAGALVVPITGGFLDANQASYANITTVAVAAARIQLCPFTPDLDVTIDQLGINVTTAVAGNGKVVVYNSNSSGWPDALIVESTDLDTGTTGFKSYSYSYTFKKGRRYWIGCRFSATPTVSAVAISALRPFGKASAASNPGCHLNIGGYAYAGAAPNPAPAANTAYFAATAPPSCMMRVA